MSIDPPFTPYDNFIAQVALGKNSVISLQNDVIGIGLTNSTMDRVGHTKRGNLVDIGAGNGYPGPTVLTITSRSIVGNRFVLVATDIQWDATGAGFGPFRHVYMYSESSNATPSEQLLIGYWSYPSAQTVVPPYPFKADFSATNGAFGMGF